MWQEDFGREPGRCLGMCPVGEEPQGGSRASAEQQCARVVTHRGGGKQEYSQAATEPLLLRGNAFHVRSIDVIQKMPRKFMFTAHSLLDASENI